MVWGKCASPAVTRNVAAHTTAAVMATLERMAVPAEPCHNRLAGSASFTRPHGLCARPGDKPERMKSCSFGTTTAVFTIAATLRGGSSARREAHTASQLLSRAASVRRHLCPLGRLTTSVAASEKAGLVRFPAAAHVIAPVTDLRTLFRSIVPCLSGPIAHLA